jgi:hypothetical protein
MISKKEVNMRQEFSFPQRRNDGKRPIFRELISNKKFSIILGENFFKIIKDCTENNKTKCITEKQKNAFLYFLGAFPEYMSDTIFNDDGKKLATTYYQAAILKKDYNNNINIGGSKKRKQVHKKKSKKTKKHF